MKLQNPLIKLFSTSLAIQQVLTSTYNNYTSPYSFNLPHSRAPNWLTHIPSNTSLTALSIPGTHDTMTYSLTSFPILQCQNHPLKTQLLSGLRYFDIRARLLNNELYIYHTPQNTNFTYVSVLLTFFSYLSTHPGESIIMRLKEEDVPINSTIDFLTAFNYYRLSSPETSAGCEKYFWAPPFPGGPDTIPTLGEIRGRILLLQNFGTEPAEYGIKWESPLLAIEDYYDVPDLEPGLTEKFQAVQENLWGVGNQTRDGGGGALLYLTHLSASEGVLPIEAAAGSLNGSVEGVNDRVGRWLEEGNGGGVGVVIMDFPGKDLVWEVLGRNKFLIGR